MRVIAKMDLMEVEDGAVTPVDYKHGAPREGENGLELWPADRMQLAVQGLILRDNGYQSEEGIVYYVKTRQRVRVQFDDALMAETENDDSASVALAAAGKIPPPLADSPKCPGCSLVGICLPDETLVGAVADAATRRCSSICSCGRKRARSPWPREVRQLVTPRDETPPAVSEYAGHAGREIGRGAASAGKRGAQAGDAASAKSARST